MGNKRIISFDVEDGPQICADCPFICYDEAYCQCVFEEFAGDPCGQVSIANFEKHYETLDN